ncbi:MAG: DUF1194 domain-containing protein [Pseudomonadota bacterium]
MHRLVFVLYVQVLLMAGLVAYGPTVRAAEVEVDVQLVLAVDVSRSMSRAELEIQRRGYAAALADEQVIRAIESGLLGRVAITYVEWAGTFSQRTVIDWTLVSNRAEALALAERLTANFSSALRRTSITGMLDHGAPLFEGNGFTSLRRIIDISGDGPNNQGGLVTLARDRTLAKGIVINGLPLMTREGVGTQFDLDDLDEYYRQCVIGGPGSFVIPVRSWEEFPSAVRQKLILELAGDTHLPVIKAQLSAQMPGGYDCQIGEKLWEQFRQIWQDLP